MAHYKFRVQTDMPTAQAFEYVADLRTFADWDPGVVRSVLIEGSAPGPDGVYDVTVLNGDRESTLRYRVTEYQPNGRLKVIGKNAFLTSIDVIEVTEEDGKTVVTYDATLRLRFPLSLGDPILQRIFNRIGGKAAVGMESALQGELVS